jgi:hypothetical protein
MILQELLPHLKALSQKEKLEALEFLRQESITEEELKAMDDADAFVREYFEKHPEQLKGCITVEGDVDIKEYFKTLAKV